MPTLTTTYLKLREQDIPASHAMRQARMARQWEALECKGRVRIRIESDTDADLSWLGKYSNKWSKGAIDRKALRAAILAHSSLFQYPILDDDHHSEIEDEDCRVTWEDCFDVSDRIDYLRRHGHGGNFRELRAAVRGIWDVAGSILNCPSDLCHC